MKANTARWVSTSGLRLAIQFWHSKTPVFTYPRGWVPWYVEWILSFPRCPRGGVSVNIWSAACGTAVAIVGDTIIYVVKNGPGTEDTQKAEAIKMPARPAPNKKTS